LINFDDLSLGVAEPTAKGQSEENSLKYSASFGYNN
jgi:hypothetical protein